MNTYTTDHGEPSSLELRVLHGPQAGSTLPMEHGQTYTLGTADSCAVLLAGTQLEPEHVALTVDGDGIQVMPLEGRVMTLDRGEVHSGQVVSLGTVLRMGRVKLTVDRVAAPWPGDDILEEAEGPAPAPEPQASQAPAHASLASRPVKRRPRPGVSGSRKRLPALVAGACIFLLAGSALAAWITSQSVEEDVPVAPVPTARVSGPKPTVLDLPAFSRGFPEATLQAARSSDGKWVVTGRIASEEGRRKLREAAAALPATPEIRVMLDAERLMAVTQFVDKKRVAGDTELNVERRAAGVIRVTGATASAASLSALLDAARTELAAMSPLEFQVLTRAELPEIFEERLRVNGLTPKFKVVQRTPQLELQARLTGPQVRAWETLFMEFTREYGSVLTVRAKVEHERDGLENQVESVVGGAFPYVVTTSGARVAPGGLIDGRTLLAIRDGELQFSDGLRVRFSN
ncbi:MAG: EscD/YscD/HrpQ family type III secretion system inner membrane ring protein [Comamonadaceae bacterium]|nr:MAG: EscD/YscD/HrpQ family type III secretion system inner membrane ring protein [Comamonadaceae bacterium]